LAISAACASLPFAQDLELSLSRRNVAGIGGVCAPVADSLTSISAYTPERLTYTFTSIDNIMLTNFNYIMRKATIFNLPLQAHWLNVSLVPPAVIPDRLQRIGDAVG
jgi:hypothetical protein